jgi:ABC-2 type transport system permease protein
MRLFSEEFKSGSFELLLTLPITVSAAVLGKFFAAWTFVATALLLTFPMPLTVAYLGNPDVGLIFSGYFASILLSGACLAIGIFFSSLSKNQVISFILTVICCAFFVYSGMPTAQTYLSSILPISLSESVASLNFLDNFMPLVKGMASLGSVLYFVIVITAWLYACCLAVEVRRNG